MNFLLNVAIIETLSLIIAAPFSLNYIMGLIQYYLDWSLCTIGYNFDTLFEWTGPLNTLLPLYSFRISEYA